MCFYLEFLESVVDLLITLVRRDKTVCRDSHIGVLLSSYTGTLKSIGMYAILCQLLSEVNF